MTCKGPLVQENMIKSLAERRKDEFAQALVTVIYRALYETYSWLTIKAAMRPKRDITRGRGVRQPKLLFDLLLRAFALLRHEKKNQQSSHLNLAPNPLTHIFEDPGNLMRLHSTSILRFPTARPSTI